MKNFLMLLSAAFLLSSCIREKKGILVKEQEHRYFLLPHEEQKTALSLSENLVGILGSLYEIQAYYGLEKTNEFPVTLIKGEEASFFIRDTPDSLTAGISKKGELCYVFNYSKADSAGSLRSGKKGLTEAAFLERVILAARAYATELELGERNLILDELVYGNK